MLKKVFFTLAVFLFTFQASATEIETKAQADAFLEKYCVALINEVAKAVKRQEAHSAKNEWQEVMEQGAYIAGVADVYSKLCKSHSDST